MELFKLIVPLGITTYILLWAVFLTGRFRAKISYHFLLASFTLALATCHAFLIIYLKFFK